ncbi:bifunctional N-acetylglucosamine-1-phosphate uridyltransferase/glucosamine-1-phosphate acetyltransferase [Streptomyces alboflavus]|uniref:Bifunctional N-acetylglucosamine-1-phosphate uridyltransferase/glucosamine-1-phosphate acetyltransferase n=1 Tax=Streptomyces alboflavus TaxID=67267 RepID=A0A1Z1WCE8_9ACTN|nr:bifunctional N-acetylglucosamine-1-phosphate uridyltransferase/glucosamine-1-phosphate acetyltransferase [Streptomyces alboflavus]
MKSATPKVLHEICGRSLVGHVLAAARELSPSAWSPSWDTRASA